MMSLLIAHEFNECVVPKHFFFTKTCKLSTTAASIPASLDVPKPPALYYYFLESLGENAYTYLRTYVHTGTASV